MKKFIIAIMSCCLLLCTGCKKEDFVSNTYKASFEYHVANPESQFSLETLINNWDAIWTSEIELTLLNTSTTDAEAHTKFQTSVTSMILKQNSWQAFLAPGDYMIYTLQRTTSGNEKVLRQVRFDENGHINL